MKRKIRKRREGRLTPGDAIFLGQDKGRALVGTEVRQNTVGENSILTKKRKNTRLPIIK